MTLHLQVGTRIAIGGVDARVTEPVTDGWQIRATFEQQHCGTMPGAVRVKSFVGHRRAPTSGRPVVFRHDVSDTESGEPLSSLIAEEWHIRTHVQAHFLGKLLQYLCRFGPERTDPPLTFMQIFA